MIIYKFNNKNQEHIVISLANYVIMYPQTTQNLQPFQNLEMFQPLWVDALYLIDV